MMNDTTYGLDSSTISRINTREGANKLIRWICENNHITYLRDLLKNEDLAAAFMLHLESFLITAIQYERQAIIELLLEHVSGCNFVFYETLVQLVTNNSIVPDYFRTLESDLDSQISKLVDAGLNSEHMTQALRHTAQNEYTTRVLLRNGADVNITGKRGHSALFFFFRGSSCFGDNLDNYTIFRNHLSKLQIAELPLSEENAKLFQVMKNKYERGYLNKYGFSDDPEIQELKKCKAECNRLKEIKLNKDTSLHSVLSKNANELAALVSNENLKNIIFSEDFRSEFPMYGYLLKLQFRKGLLRKALLASAQSAMHFIKAEKVLPADCSLEILKLLSNTDLANVIRASFVSSV